MAAISELIRTEADGTISFGDYTLGAKAKLDNYEFHGDMYKVKTFKEITKLERNGLFVYESVPGTAVTNFKQDEKTVSFTVEGPEEAEIIYGKNKNACVILSELRIRVCKLDGTVSGMQRVEYLR